MLLLERTAQTFRIRFLFVQFAVSPNEMNEKIPSKIEKYSRRAAVIVPNALPFHSTCVSELINKFHLKKKTNWNMEIVKCHHFASLHRLNILKS